ncbi:GDSL-type esterase/lipase family protein [Bosea sp. 117]|uniref:DUF459 domain-containing protein n=1 Tax=Bosea sp. 117 TaxID=1125973 RepID=UPI0004947836|nr:GDSL-type esterase/lipase family protein [Bosea sp. 117]
MRQSGSVRAAVRVLAVAGAVMVACPAAQAQQDWFRPPGSVGQPSRAAPQQQVRPSQQRQQARPQQVRPAPPPQQQGWNPLFPLFEIFRSPAPPQQRYAAPPPMPETEQKPRKAVQIEQPAEPRGTVFASVEDARKNVEKPPTDVVLVIGDEFAAPLAQGLADAFAPERAGIAVVGKGESGTGLAPDGKYDWVVKGPELANANAVNAIVIFMGGNDLHPIEDATGKLPLFDEKWIEIYGRRLDELFAGLKMVGRPVVVVGLPPVDDIRASDRNAKLNELVREHVERAGLIYVDIWDGFVDENGKFFMSGPAVDGQRRRLRTSDGVGFTRAGGRKLAFFVDRVLGKLLNGQPSAPVPDAGTGTPAASGPPSLIQLTGAATGGRALAGAKPVESARLSGTESHANGEGLATRVLVGGETLSATEGRVDDFRWRPPGAETPPATPASAPGATPGADTTGAPASSPATGSTATP